MGEARRKAQYRADPPSPHQRLAAGVVVAEPEQADAGEATPLRVPPVSAATTADVISARLDLGREYRWSDLSGLSALVSAGWDVAVTTPSPYAPLTLLSRVVR